MNVKYYVDNKYNQNLNDNKKTDGAAGYDIESNHFFVIPPFSFYKLNSGIHFEIPEGYEIQLRNRSSNTGHGFIIMGSPMTIDSDYRGPLYIPLYNLCKDHVHIYEGQRVAQILLKKTESYSFNKVDSFEELSQTKRGQGGFGSTGTV